MFLEYSSILLLQITIGFLLYAIASTAVPEKVKIFFAFKNNLFLSECSNIYKLSVFIYGIFN